MRHERKQLYKLCTALVGCAERGDPAGVSDMILQSPYQHESELLVRLAKDYLRTNKGKGP